MRFDASDIHDLYRPSPCALRARLAKRGEKPTGEPNAFTALLRELGQRHEEQHLRDFPVHLDLSEGDFDQRHQATLEAVRRGEDVLYQPVLFGWRQQQDERDFIVGIPDLLIRTEDGYVIRDCKLALSADEKSHPETLRQLELYGWLYEQCFGRPPLRLEVLLGNGSLRELGYDGGATALAVLDEIKRVALAPEEHYEPVGWTKCNTCGFFDRCWDKARQRHDVALLVDVDQGLARHLHESGVSTYQQLAERFTPGRLAEERRLQGDQLRRVGTKAGNILQHARALSMDTVLQLNRFPHTLDQPYVVLDLEGLPQEMDELEKAYLWGMQVCGPVTGPYRAAVAPLDHDGDRIGWERFLTEAERVLDDHGDIRFIHYAPYERTMIARYVTRYGDRHGVAARVLDRLLDLYPLTRQTVVLPEPSYSLKVVERRAGFRRTMDEYGGSWSIARYIQAVEANDAAIYEDTMEEILRYNREDLEATWAVFRWLASSYSGVPPSA